MALTNSPRYRRVFIQAMTSGSPRIIQNGTGTWTNTGAKLLRIPVNSLEVTPNQPITPNPTLTGTRSPQPGIDGRKSATWAIRDIPMIPSGTAGTAWDSDALWQCVFGQEPTVSAGTSVSYAFNDTGFLPFALFDFPHNIATLTSRTIWGCVVEEVLFTFNGNIFNATVSGQAGFQLESTNFSSEDTTGKAGLTVYPAEPNSASVLGTIQKGFQGTVTIDGQTLEGKVRSMQLRVRTGTRWVADLYSDPYPVEIVGGPRQISLTIGMVDDDSAALNDIKQKAKASPRPTLATSIVLGTVAGNIFTFTIPTLQMLPAAYVDETDIVMTNFPEAPAYASAVGNVDDFSFQLT